MGYVTYPDLNLPFCVIIAPGSCLVVGQGVIMYNLGIFYTRKLNVVCYLGHNG